MVDSVTKSGNDDAASTKIVHDHDIIGSSKEAHESAENAHVIGFNEQELILEKKLRWKIDLMIMPLLIWTYLMNYIDRLVGATKFLGCDI